MSHTKIELEMMRKLENRLINARKLVKEWKEYSDKPSLTESARDAINYCIFELENVLNDE